MGYGLGLAERRRNGRLSELNQQKGESPAHRAGLFACDRLTSKNPVQKKEKEQDA